MKKICKLFTVFTLLFSLVGCGNTKKFKDDYIHGVIIVENYGEMEFELYPEIAPITVENFVNLANSGFYDGLIFHRVIDHFMIQGGGFDKDLNPKETDTIVGEFALNGWEANNLSHTQGVLSMARAALSMDSASSQFFICYENCEQLDGSYAAFGKLTSGCDVLEKIVKVETTIRRTYEDVPVDTVTIKTIKIYK